MNCPKCKKSDTKVIDSRIIDLCIKRRRQCISCSYRFTTYETPGPLDIKVVKRNGEIQKFDVQKITNSISKACNKRPIDTKNIKELSEHIKHCIYAKYQDQVSSKTIGNMVLEKLLEIDKIAYLRFASVYKNFKNLGNFDKEIKKLNSK